MERIFKIRAKTKYDPRGLYPSERRYSASNVLGLSVMHLTHCVLSIIMGALLIRKMSDQKEGRLNEDTFDNSLNDSMKRLIERLEKDLNITEATNLRYYVDNPELLCAGCFVMYFGHFLTFVAGMLAWRRWYIDHNIMVFFLLSTISKLTSFFSLMISFITTLKMRFHDYDSYMQVASYDHTAPYSLSFAVNVIILSILGVFWSVMSVVLAYRGVRNRYPDDLNMSTRTRNIQDVCVAPRDNNNIFIIPQDVVKCSQTMGFDKLAKYFVNDENSGLPNADKNKEYEQRVARFLNEEKKLNENANENKI